MNSLTVLRSWFGRDHRDGEYEEDEREYLVAKCKSSNLNLRKTRKTVQNAFCTFMIVFVKRAEAKWTVDRLDCKCLTGLSFGCPGPYL
jgi:hypothetical protein